MLAEPYAGQIMGSLARRLAELRDRRGPAVPGFGARVGELIVVASSSRGGSSMLAEVLRECDGLVHLRAEINPFLRLVGLAHPDSGSGSDRLDAGHLHALAPSLRQVLDDELALDVGNPRATIGDDEEFAHDVAWRVAVQWPALECEPAEVAGTALRLLGRLRQDGPVDWRRFHFLLVGELRAAGQRVDPSYYDQPAGHGGGPRRGPRLGPPGEVLAEEPPFVLPGPGGAPERRTWRPGRW